jgi:hypothetical protein
VLRFDKPPAEAALFFPEHSFSSRSDDLLVRGPIGVVLLNIITLLVEVALKTNNIIINNRTSIAFIFKRRVENLMLRKYINFIS